MNLRTIRRVSMLLGFALVMTSPVKADTLEEGFANPPQQARPQVWWHWLNGNITKEGITTDLESMRRAGIGGATIFNTECGIPEGKVTVFTPEWRAMLRHAAAEARRLGIELGVHNCPGWTCSGGPWNMPANAMQVVVSSETRVQGPLRFSGALPKPATRIDYFKDIAVLAMKTPEGFGPLMSDLNPKITASAEPFDAGSLVDRNAGTAAVLPLPKPGKPQFVQFEFAQPFRAQAILVTVPGGVDYTADYGLHDCAVALQASDDGVAFRPVRKFVLERKAFGPMPLGFSFEPVSARFYRVLFTKIGERSPRLALAEIELLSRPRIENLETKANFTTGVALQPENTRYPSQAVVRRGDVIDLTRKVGGNGVLTWDVPEGNWTIVRFAHTATGKGNHPAPAAGYGLECDKLSKEALEAHWNGSVKPILDEARKTGGKILNMVLIDSYEVGGQNWTPRMREEFQRRRGYDPVPYLPVLTGRVVGSTDETDRFLWDLRRTVSDLFAANYYGHFQELCHKNGVIAAAEPYTGPFESMEAGAGADIPFGEFWASGKPHGSLKLASSIGHIHGRSVIAAESFTLGPPLKGWQQDAFFYKGQGDLVYTLGVNRFVLHRFAHQPWPKLVPGMTMGQWGSFFDGSNTWWDQGRAWMEYCARSQFLLQSGRFVADLLYFTGEDSTTEFPTRDRLQPPPPDGYDYDAIGPDLLQKLKVSKGRLTLPSGMSYRLLVLPAKQQLSAKSLAKVRKLVLSGALVVGPRPQQAPGLERYPNGDREIKAIAKGLWGTSDESVTRYPAGKGRVLSGAPLERVLTQMGATPDFECISQKDAGMVYIHRRTKDADLYFVSNQKTNAVQVECAFRVQGKLPELWHADTGRMEQAAVFRQAEGRTIVPLRLDGWGSVFVVFRKPAAPGHWASASFVAERQDVLTHDFGAGASGTLECTAWVPGTLRATHETGKTREVRVATLPKAMGIEGPWQVAFQPGRAAPDKATFESLISWTKHSDVAVKYFSGTATYTKAFELPEKLSSDTRLMLDLGTVRNFAEVILNGRSLGVLWKPPFRVDITSAAKPGENRLEVKITNLWCNRLIGDEQLPDDMEWAKTGFWAGSGPERWPDWLLKDKPRPSGRIAFSTWQYFDKGTPLLDAGLLGPVEIHFGKRVSLDSVQ